MQLSKFSDYAFRALVYLASNSGDKLTTVEFMSRELGISQNHLKKVVHRLTKGGFVESFKGNKGGIRLARDPRDTNLGEVLLFTETNMSFVDCLKQESGSGDCPHEQVCNLKLVISRAKKSFIDEISKFDLVDLISADFVNDKKLR